MKKISLKNKKVFIAGHAGLVGQSLYKRLEKEKCKSAKYDEIVYTQDRWCQGIIFRVLAKTIEVSTTC